MTGRDSILKITIYLIIFSFLFGVIASPLVNSQSAEVPTWHEGDTWKYEYYQTKDPSIIYINVTSTKENVKIDEEIFPCYETKWTSIYQGNKSSDIYFYTKDNLAETAINISEDRLIFYSPPRKDLNFPLKEGKEWDVITTQYLKEGDNESEARQYFKINFKCEEKTQVQTSAGNFEVYKINRTIESDKTDNYELLYYSPRVKNFVKFEFYGPRGGIQQEQFLVSYDLQEGDDNPSNGDDTPFVNTSTLIILTISTAVMVKLRNKLKNN